MKFENGQNYQTLKTLGLARKSDGSLQLSQKIDQGGGPDVPPTENLKFVGRENGKLWFLREDGTKISGHPSHFDPNHAYNRAGNTNATSGADRLAAAKARLARAEADLARAAERLAAASRSAQTTVPVVQPEAEPEVLVSVEDRNEADELFNS